MKKYCLQEMNTELRVMFKQMVEEVVNSFSLIMIIR
jgi:hypothetical protein